MRKYLLGTLLLMSMFFMAALVRPAHATLVEIDQQELPYISAFDPEVLSRVSFSGTATSWKDGDEYLITIDGIMTVFLAGNVMLNMPYYFDDSKDSLITQFSYSLETGWGSVTPLQNDEMIQFLLAGWAGWTVHVECRFQSYGDASVKVREQVDSGYYGEVDWCELSLNTKPNTPSTPSGPTSGHRYEWYTYSTSTTDPEGNDVRYQFEFTGPNTNVSWTTGWHESGQTGSITVRWVSSDPLGTYQIRARAQDVYEKWSNWSPYLTVSIHDYLLTISSSSGGTTEPSSGTYAYSYGSSVTVNASPYTNFHFNYWILDGAQEYANPITVTMNSDHTLKAYFQCDWGGPGCPILSVYGGTGYVEEGLLDIHNPDGEDVITNHVLIHTPEPVEHRHLLRLTEHPQTYSHIDQVRLFAMLTNGTEVKLPLVSAIHSEDGDVKQELLLSDDVRVDTLGADHNNGTSQYIDLKFVAPDELEIQQFTFIIEGHNPIFKLPY